jgi:hypothetical protein
MTWSGKPDSLHEAWIQVAWANSGLVAENMLTMLPKRIAEPIDEFRALSTRYYGFVLAAAGESSPLSGLGYDARSARSAARNEQSHRNMMSSGGWSRSDFALLITFETMERFD